MENTGDAGEGGRRSAVRGLLELADLADEVEPLLAMDVQALTGEERVARAIALEVLSCRVTRLRWLSGVLDDGDLPPGGGSRSTL
jgi:hypothetical protein